MSDGAEASKISKKWRSAQRSKDWCQESQDSDEAGSRKSSRKRTALTKFGGVIIDSIFKTRQNKGEGEKERDTN